MTQEKCSYCGIENSTIKDWGGQLFCKLCFELTSLNDREKEGDRLLRVVLNIGNRILEKLK